MCPESHIGLGKVYPGAYTTTGELLVSTSPELGRLIQLEPYEVVLEVQIKILLMLHMLILTLDGIYHLHVSVLEFNLNYLFANCCYSRVT